MGITEDIFYVGVNDHQIDLFEGQYKVENGMSYNSYIIMDEKIAVMDTVDKNFTHEWLDNIARVLDNKKPDYLVVLHMEPDHSANIMNFLKVYPETIVVGNVKTFKMIEQFFPSLSFKKMIVENNQTLSLSESKHNLTFVFAPMVHWPEVMVAYDSYSKVLFSADAFGKFGALDKEQLWDDEARRYYIGIVGKYGMQVQMLLKKAASLDIKIICPLHGPILDNNLEHYFNLYNLWSSYQAEEDGILIAYTSVYGNTKNAILELVEKIKEYGCNNIVVVDLARFDMSLAVSLAFKYDKLVLATTTYNASIFPYMREFINHLTERNYSNRMVGLIENGSWSPLAIKTIKEMFLKSKNINFLKNEVTILSSLNDDVKMQLDLFAQELCHEYMLSKDTLTNKKDLNALSNIGYGLYVITSFDGKKDNGLIVNTVSQVSDNPLRIAITINKLNYSYHIIKQTGIMNVNCLSIDSPFSIFKKFGFQSGRNVDKFANENVKRSANGLVYLSKYINAYFSLKVEQFVDLDSHGMFICSISEARVINNQETMTYSYYHQNIKEKADVSDKKGYVCKICGYVYEGDTLPSDFVCPLCKHGAADFEKIE